MADYGFLKVIEGITQGLVSGLETRRQRMQEQEKTDITKEDLALRRAKEAREESFAKDKFEESKRQHDEEMKFKKEALGEKYKPVGIEDDRTRKHLKDRDTYSKSAANSEVEIAKLQSRLDKTRNPSDKNLLLQQIKSETKKLESSNREIANLTVKIKARGGDAQSGVQAENLELSKKDLLGQTLQAVDSPEKAYAAAEKLVSEGMDEKEAMEMVVDWEQSRGLAPVTWKPTR